MKKLLLSILAMSLITVPVIEHARAAGYYDVDQNDFYAESINILTGLDIVSGNGDGTFNPNGLVKRAEAAKMVCVMMDLSRDSAGSLFLDVAEDFWGVGYINATALNGIFTGYPGGYFAPDANMTFSEAITIADRMLGYNSSNITGAYPWAYINKAEKLGVLDNLSFDPNAAIDRKNIAYIFANALQTDMESGDELVTKLDCTISDECTVLANYQSSASEISTTIGNYKFSGNKSKYYGTKVKLITDNDNRVKCIIPLTAGNTYGVANVLGNEITYVDGNGKHIIKLSNSDRVIYDGSETTFGDVKSSLDDELQITLFYDDKGDYDYCVLEECEMSSPVIATTGGVNPFGTDSVIVRDGEVSNVAGIKVNDVCYLAQNTNTVYAYCDTVLGVYEKAEPDKSNPTSVKISGKVYSIETSEAAEALSKAQYNSYIEVLLGKDGEVAGVKDSATTDDATKRSTLTASSSAFSSYGVVLSCKKKTACDKEGYYATCLTATGETQDFKISKSRDDMVGKIAKYAFTDDYFTPTTLTNKSLSGTLDKYAGKIGTKYLSDDFKIYDVDYVIGQDTAYATEVNISDISNTTLSKDDILGFVTDSAGDISILYLNNVTMLNMDFGIVTSLRKENASTYTLTANFSEKTYSSDINLNVGYGKAVAFKVYGGKIIQLKSLYSMIDAEAPSSFDSSRIRTAKKTIDLVASTVYFVKNKSDQYMQYEYDELDIDKIKTVTVYSDLSLTDGGRGRVVVVMY